MMKTYQPGKMGKSEAIAIAYIITIPRVFLTAPSSAIDTAAGAAWMHPLVTGVTAIIMLLAASYVLEKTGGDFFEAAEGLIGRLGAGLLIVALAAMFFIDGTILLRLFAENTLLTALPSSEFSVTILLYATIAGILVYGGLEVLARTNYLLLPISIAALVLVLLLLIPFYDMHHLLPWAGKGLGATILSGMLVAGFNAGALALLILSSSFQNMRALKDSILYGVGISAGLKSFCTLIFTLVLGYSAGREKLLPFFEMARLVYLNRYIQRVESIFILLWVINGVLAIAVDMIMFIYLISRLLRLPALRPIVPLTCTIMAQLAMMPGNVTLLVEKGLRFVGTYMTFMIYAVPALLVAAYMIRGRKGRRAKCIAD